MRNAFSPVATGAVEGPRGANVRYLTVPISGQVNLAAQGEACDSSNAGTLHYGPGSRTNGYSRAAGGKPHTGALTRDGSASRTRSGGRAGEATPAPTDERSRVLTSGQGEPGGLYKQSFDPASRMIQKQKFLKQYEQSHARATHKVNVVTPSGLRQRDANSFGYVSQSFNLAAQLSGGALAQGVEGTRNDQGQAKNAAAGTLKSTVTGGASTVHGKGSITPNIGSNAHSVANADLQHAKNIGQALNKSSYNVGADPAGTKPGTARHPGNLKIDSTKANQDLTLFLEGTAVTAEAGAPTPYQVHDYSPMALPLKPKQLDGGAGEPSS